MKVTSEMSVYVYGVRMGWNTALLTLNVTSTEIRSLRKKETKEVLVYTQKEKKTK